jgi:hypothetical protein
MSKAVHDVLHIWIRALRRKLEYLMGICMLCGRTLTVTVAHECGLYQLYGLS